jgi:hypothetical protein
MNGEFTKLNCTIPACDLRESGVQAEEFEDTHRRSGSALTCRSSIGNLQEEGIRTIASADSLRSHGLRDNEWSVRAQGVGKLVPSGGSAPPLS